jgi:tRNA (guanosine-2'-O-)-methyltransferase
MNKDSEEKFNFDFLDTDGDWYKARPDEVKDFIQKNFIYMKPISEIAEQKMKKGFYGIGIYETKEDTNVGTLWRSAQNFGADFIFIIGARYKKQRTDTCKTYRNIPLFAYKDYADFLAHIPMEAELVFVEQNDESKDLKEFVHPKQAIYILGAEDYGVPVELMKGYRKVEISSPMCLNVAVAGSIVMYDRNNKLL